MADEPTDDLAQAPDDERSDDEKPRRKKKKRRKTPPAESFALYLAKRYIAEKSFTLDVPAEAQELAEACDIALAYADGYAFSLLLIVDAEKDPERRWTLGVGRMVEIGKACLKYTGTVNRAKLPVTIHVIEVRTSFDEADKRRLKPLQRMPGLAKVGVYAVLIAPATADAWSSAFLGWIGLRWLRAVMTEPRRSDAELTIPAAAVGANAGRPWITIALLTVMLAVFTAEQLFAAGPPGKLLAPSLATLVAMGGVSQNLVVLDGEWWRLLTATLLHGDPIHLALNGFALFMAGYVLESMLGGAWLFALFFVGAIGGSLASILVNPPALVSVGASGAIMGLLAAAIVASFRLQVRERAQVQMPLLQLLVPSLIPLAVHRSAGRIDFAAHLGGALLGAALGVLLLRVWPRTEARPRFGGAARVASIAGALAYVAAVALASSHHADWAVAGTAELYPDDGLANLKPAEAPTLLARYPHDPRIHWLAAIAASERGDPAAAERELRAALAERAMFRVYDFGEGKLERELQADLAKLGR